MSSSVATHSALSTLSLSRSLFPFHPGRTLGKDKLFSSERVWESVCECERDGVLFSALLLGYNKLRNFNFKFDYPLPLPLPLFLSATLRFSLPLTNKFNRLPF